MKSHAIRKDYRQTFLSGLMALLLFAVMALSASLADAAGLLIADGGFGGVLKIKTHEAHVTVNNGIAVTRVTQVFENTEDRQVEALYTFPVPKGASVATTMNRWWSRAPSNCTSAG